MNPRTARLSWIWNADLRARLRPSNIDASTGCVKEVARIVARIREVWPEVQITLRGDWGFCREEIMESWCEQNLVDSLLGLTKNERLTAELVTKQQQAAAEFRATDKAAPVFKEFRYQTRGSWLWAPRAIAKAEHLEEGANRSRLAGW